MSFLNVVEIESALQGLATAYPSISRLVTLPFSTAEGRQSHALVIGAGTRCPESGVLIISGTHAREWGGPDICINFAADLLEAYSLASGLVYGGTAYSSAQIKSPLSRRRKTRTSDGFSISFLKSAGSSISTRTEATFFIRGGTTPTSGPRRPATSPTQPGMAREACRETRTVNSSPHVTLPGWHRQATQ